MPTIGEAFKASGYSPNLPLLVVPGLCSSILRVQETTYEPWADKRIWLNLSAIGLGKVWDFNITLFGDSKKKPKIPTPGLEESTERVEREETPKRERSNTDYTKNKKQLEKSKKSRRERRPKEEGDEKKKTPKRKGENDEDSKDEEEEEIQVAEVDDNLKRRWIKHMILQEDGVSDPPGIKLRAMEGLYGCAYLEPSNRATKALSYVFGPFFEMLQDIGYTDTNLRAAPYDWRLPPSILEQRDGYFTKLSQMIMEMKVLNGKKVVLLGHSLGTRVLQYFFRWAVEQPSLGRQWISDYVETYLAVGPIFLGAPKTLRAMVTGERMGLEAFLFPEEGVALNRRLGSIPWMFPVRTEDAGKESLVPLTMERKGENYYSPITDPDLMKTIYPPMYEIYKQRFAADKFHGPHEHMIDPPPVDNLYAIYGINMETESFCFVKKNNETGNLEIDNEGKLQLPGYKCRGGIGYETKDTPQRLLRGEKRSGDGTVPYASLFYCSKWADQMNVRIDELEQCDHRDILKDKRFLRLVVKYICRNPPPPMLPESFPDLEYPVSATFGGRKHDCVIKIRRQGIKVVGKGHLVGQAIKTKCKYQAILDVSIDEESPGVFRIDVPGATRIKKLRSKFRREIVEEIASRCRYADRLAEQADEDEDVANEKKEERDAFGQTALHRAASENKLAEAKEQIELGSDVNAVDANGWTPLHCAARRGHLDVVIALLMSKDINVNMVNKEGLSALHYLVRLSVSGPDELLTLKRTHQIWTLMGKKGANINRPAGDGDTPLHSAATRGNEEALRWLLSHEAINIHAFNTKGDTALHLAIRSKHFKSVWILLQAGADKFISAPSGETPISLAYNISNQLFALMCGVTVADLKTPLPWPTGKDYERLKHSDSARMALQIACRNKRLDWAFLLVNEEHKDVIPVINNNGLMPIHIAAKFGTWDILMLLLRSNLVDVNELSTEKANFLHYFVQFQAGVEDASEEKLQHVWETAYARKVNIEQKNKYGESPLHIAAVYRRLDALKWLIEKGVSVDSTNNGGETPLHYAIRAGDPKIIKELINSNANVYHNSQKSGTPLDLAYKTDRTLVDYLRPKLIRGNVRKSLMISKEDEVNQSPAVDEEEELMKKLKQEVNAKRRTVIFSRKSRILPTFEGDEIEESVTNGAPKLSPFQQQQKKSVKTRFDSVPDSPDRSSDSELSSSPPTSSPISNSEVLNSPENPGDHSSVERNSTPRVPTTSILRGRGNRADKARGVKIDFQAIEKENQKDSEWQSVMSAIKFANAELHLEEISATSDNKLVTVYMNGKGDVKKIAVDEGATEDDRVQALNFCTAKQRRIAFTKHNRALEGVATDEVKDILNGTMYATTQ